ncbi:leucyl/phenylalanyl-tRNA--protein transferase [Croceicoccus ponticola]|uniref:Leucyl/phenylalanyl-tRNA--protein transferase n=1 Tax=Croceicoccus ponticola TaxID=2217664 RepID=A0A437H2M0_9SPHN|nr:leucyl/phenylalanyl-tRNA--protein transferase [Croceicoccus ponticola]RVQ69799.1 leucyl/phenylalanyl-tRNA--protein transferase [Croceicoccus ponticola]
MSKLNPPPGTQSLIDPELLLLAYRSGIFPMAETRDDPEIMWIEPRERAILPLEGLNLSRSLLRTLRRDRFEVTCNRAFEGVIARCAAPRDGEDDDVSESWISKRITDSYVMLHKLGHAHSIECWRDGQLVGGLYGVAFDRVFCGESMFSLESDASKVALCWLVAAMQAAGMELLDCQFMTTHLASLGAVAMPQARYMELVAKSCRPADEAPYVALPEGFSSLAAASSSPGKTIAQSLIQTS